ncbi:major capsid family protein [Providencia stuartii]|uniref:major capsid family protein n=1 Tax=Providencia manganoxydans TaxID=2923283 RepID=UPI0024AC6370
MFTVDRATIDSAGVFLVGELERMDQTLNLPLTSVKWTRDMPLRSDISIADEVSSFTNTDFASVGGPNPNGKNWMGKKGTAIAGIELSIDPTRNNLTPWAQEVGWTVLELASAQKLGRPIDTQKYEGMKLKWQMDTDEQVYIGDSELGVPGLLNLPSVSPVAAAAAWTATTDPDVIVQDINLVLTDAWVRSGYAVCPGKIGLAPELFGLLASKKVSSAGNISVLEYVKINTIAFQENGEPLEIVSMKFASKRGAGGAHRIVAYTQDEKYVRFPMVPLLNTPLEYRGMQQLTVYYGKLGQVETPYSNTISYLDIPAA